MKNYIYFGGRFHVRYAYIDTHSYVADSLFYKHEIPVKFSDEFVREGDRYRIIFCSIRKKHRKEFEKALLELHNKMLICGYSDYDEYCENVMKWIENNEK